MPGNIFSVTMSLDGFIAPHSSPGDLDALHRGGEHTEPRTLDGKPKGGSVGRRTAVPA